jgi:hypothetical protein
MRWLHIPHISRTWSYISVIVADQLHIVLLHKNTGTYSHHHSCIVQAEDAGILNGIVYNPSFFAWQLYHFFEQQTVRCPRIGLLIMHEHPAYQLQHLMYGTYFRLPIEKVRYIMPHTIGMHVLNPDQSHIKNYYLQQAIDLWQGASHAKS